jgi:RNA polymerase sigma factor (sigma-70 family)
MRPDERELVRRARRGAPEAVEQLFRLHWHGAWQAAYAVTVRRELANDVAQEAFVRAVSSLRRFDDSRPFAPWLTRIAVNLAIDELRRERRLDPRDAAEPPAAPEPESDDDVVRAVGPFRSAERVYPPTTCANDHSCP